MANCINNVRGTLILEKLNQVHLWQSQAVVNVYMKNTIYKYETCSPADSECKCYDCNSISSKKYCILVIFPPLLIYI